MLRPYVPHGTKKIGEGDQFIASLVSTVCTIRCVIYLKLCLEGCFWVHIVYQQ